MATTFIKKQSEKSQNKEKFEISTNADENDIFKHHFDCYGKSKTIKFLNFLYSLIVGLLSNTVSVQFTKHSKLIGLLIGILSFMLNRKFLRVESSPQDIQRISESSQI